MDRIISMWMICIIFIQKILDIIHSFLFGIPILKNSQITANLYLGSQYNLIGLQKLKKLGITAIVNMRMHSVYDDAHFAHIKYIHLPTFDNTPPEIEDLIKGASFVENEIKNGGKVYIHCREGLGRGPTMTIAYLLKIGVEFDDAFNMIKKVRPFINPRPEQIMRLKELEIIYKSAKNKDLV